MKSVKKVYRMHLIETFYSNKLKFGSFVLNLYPSIAESRYDV